MLITNSTRSHYWTVICVFSIFWPHALFCRLFCPPSIPADAFHLLRYFLFCSPLSLPPPTLSVYVCVFQWGWLGFPTIAWVTSHLEEHGQPTSRHSSKEELSLPANISSLLILREEGTLVSPSLPPCAILTGLVYVVHVTTVAVGFGLFFQVHMWHKLF